MVSSAMPELVERSSRAPTTRSWSIIVSWYGRLPAAGLAEALRLGVGPEVHVRGVQPDEERCLRLVLPADEVECVLGDLVVDRLHPLLGQRTGVLDPLLATAAVPPVLGRVVLVGGPGVKDAARTEALVERREVLDSTASSGSSGSSSALRW